MKSRINKYLKKKKKERKKKKNDYDHKLSAEQMLHTFNTLIHLSSILFNLMQLT